MHGNMFKFECLKVCSHSAPQLVKTSHSGPVATETTTTKAASGAMALHLL